MRSRQHRRLRVGPMLLLLLNGCGGGPGEAADATPEWSLSAEPTLVIGGDVPPEAIFGEIVAVAGFASGEVAVVDRQAEEVRLFGPRGDYLRTLARRGGGPGDFEAIHSVQAVADSLLAKDLMRGTVTVIGIDGAVHRQVRVGVDSSANTLSLVRRLTGGRWLAVTESGWGMPATDVMHQDSVTFGLLGADGSGPFDPVATTLGEPLILLPATRTFGFARFHVSGIALQIGNQVAVVHPDTGFAQVFNSAGAEVARFTIPIPRRALEQGDAAAALEYDLAQSRSERGRAEVPRFYAVEPRPALLPVVRTALADGSDALWLEEFQLDLTAPRRYHVVRTDGSLLGRVSVPVGIRLHQVGPDWVLGTTEDESGVPQVVRYGLVRR